MAISKKLSLAPVTSVPPIGSRSLRKLRITGFTLFFLIAGFQCIQQVTILTRNYLKYDTYSQSTWNYNPTIIPPNFSICVDILKLLNITLMLEKHPRLRELAIEVRAGDPSLANWTLAQVIQDYETGTKFALDWLNIRHITELALPLSAIMTKCKYLTTGMTQANCDDRYFHRYLFNCLYCFEFKWYISDRINMSTPSFPSGGLHTLGYHVLRLVDIHLNLSDYPNLNEIITMAHAPYRIPWDDESDLYKLQVENRKSIVFGITYSEEVIRNLPSPFPTECKDFGSGLFRSVQDCWHNCSVSRFYHQTGYYPRYAIIRNFNNSRKILDAYKKQEPFHSLIQKIQEECLSSCGRTECMTKKYGVFTLYKPTQVVERGKFVVLHYSPPAYHQYQRELVAKYPFSYFWASFQTLIAFFFGINYHTGLNFIVDKLFDWLEYLYQIIRKRQRRSKGTVSMNLNRSLVRRPRPMVSMRRIKILPDEKFVR